MNTRLFNAVASAVIFFQAPSTQLQSPRARIEGVVLRAGSTEPVVGARVTLARPNELNTDTTSSSTSAGGSLNLLRVPPVTAGDVGGRIATVPPLPIPPVLTDNGGRFSFSDIEAGTYRLLVQQDGFVRQEYGQRISTGQGTPLNLNSGDVLKDLTIRLTPAGNVGGRIVENSGKPAVSVPLQLLRAVYNRFGQRTFQTAGNARTNDRGEYRFYWITPGRYYLAGGTPQGVPATPGGIAGSPNESGDSYAVTFYPGVTDITRAIALEVRPGGDLVADFSVAKQQLFTIRGRIVDPTTAAPPPSASIALAYQQMNGTNFMFSRNPIYNPATGAFELREVIPGPYLVYANTLGGSARASVEVVNANIDEVVLTVNTGISIAGRVSSENGKFPAATTIQLRPMIGGSPSLVGNLPSAQSIASDGTFSINGVLPGMYRLSLPSLTDFYVKQMQFDRFDALNQPIEVVQRGQEVPTLDIVVSSNVSQVEGVVSDARLQPSTGVVVVLIPDNRDRMDLYKTSTSDQSGHFSIRGIAPGDYKLFAWEDIENNAYFDPDFMRRSESSGKPVRVTESSKQFLNMQILAN